MNDRQPKLFESLEPPRGGLAGLRARIARDTRRRVLMRRLQTATAALLVLAVAGLTILDPRGRRESPLEFRLARMSLGLIPPPSEILTIPEERRHQIAVRRVPLQTDEVLFYLVAPVRENTDPHP